MLDRKEKIIKVLEDKLLNEVYKKEFDYRNKPIWLVPENITYKDIFARYKKTGRNIYKDNYIASLCLRLTQAGFPCYPINKKAEFTGIMSTLKDDDVTEILFIDHLIDGDVTKSIEYICSLDRSRQENQELAFA